MGCWYSRMVDREEMVSRCKARKRYMKQVVKSRHAFSAAHSLYLRSLRNTGAALLHFSTAETKLHNQPQPQPQPQGHHHHHHLPPLPPSPPPPRRVPPPLSPNSWTTTSTTTSSAIHPPPPPPPPPHPPSSSAWDFWDPFMPTSGRSVDEEEWEEATSGSEVAPTTTPSAADAPPSVVTATATTATATATATATSSDLAVVVSAKSKDLVEIIRELDEYFLKAANAGGEVSLLLEVPACNFSRQTSSDYGHGKSLNPLVWTQWGSSSSKWNALGKFCEDPIGTNLGSLGGNGNSTHCSTVERLYAWEKKLYDEVKNAEYLKIEHEKKATALRKLEMRNADYFKTEKAKKETEKLESQMLVAAQAIETTSAEIIKLRELELYPQLLELVKGLMSMWRSMYEFHQVQTHIVQQLKYLNCIPSTDATSEIHRQSTLQLELEAQQWHVSFCNLMKSQRDYIQSLTGWLRLSLFNMGNKPVHRTRQDSAIYSLCEEWQLAINNAPDKVASEGIKSFLTMIHAIVVQQADEQKQKKRYEATFKDFEKKAGELRSLESKHGPYSSVETSTGKNPVWEKRAKVEITRAKAEDENAKYEKSVSVTRAMTMNNLQMGLPHVFQAMTGFANVCRQAYECVHNQARSINNMHNMKMILPADPTLH